MCTHNILEESQRFLQNRPEKLEKKPWRGEKMKELLTKYPALSTRNFGDGSIPHPNKMI